MNATIELKEILILAGVPVTLAILVMLYRHRERIIAILKTVVVLSCLGGIGAGAYWYAPEPQIIEKIVKVAVPVQDDSTKEERFWKAYKQLPLKYGINPLVVDIFFDKERDKGKGMLFRSYRYEPTKIDKARKYSKDVEQQRMIASSHCPFQIMGYTAADLGVDWDDLYNPEICVDTAMRVIEMKRNECIKNKEDTSRYDLLKCLSRRYNGSGEMAERYSRDFMDRYARRIINEGELQ